MLAAVNVCGYDQELASSLPVRAEVRLDLVAASKSPETAAAAKAMCAFYEQHRQPASGNSLAPYVSLALNLGPPADFVPKFLEADLASGCKLRFRICSTSEVLRSSGRFALDLGSSISLNISLWLTSTTTLLLA